MQFLDLFNSPANVQDCENFHICGAALKLLNCEMVLIPSPQNEFREVPSVVQHPYQHDFHVEFTNIVDERCHWLPALSANI